jgi:chaperonin GroEL
VLQGRAGDLGRVKDAHFDHVAELAGLAITTEAIVAEVPKKDDGHGHGGGAPGGMGGMGGMDF